MTRLTLSLTAALVALALFAAPALGGIDAMSQAAGQAPRNGKGPTKVVVLMMENRSWDHYFGYNQKGTDRLNGTETNCVIPGDESSDCITITNDQADHAKTDAPHGLDDVTMQIFGYMKPHNVTAPPMMNGFVAAAKKAKLNVENPMQCLTDQPSSGSILNYLAREFAVTDRWFCSLPGPTDPNRAFAMSGTSQGVTSNFNGTLWTQTSYFEWLRQHNRTFSAVYQDDLWAIGYFKDMHKKENTPNIKQLDTFMQEVKDGKLADFTWLQPRMTSHKGQPTWQHPTASILEGERLMKDVYEALRASPVWDDLVFVITYDEHGGFYDHVHPPQEGVPAPDGHRDKTGFRFDRQGVRIPTVIISPWIEKNTIVHDPYPGDATPTPTSQFDGTSTIATATRILGLGRDKVAELGDRARWAATFEPVFTRTTPRTDAPKELPVVPRTPPHLLPALRRSVPDDHIVSQLIFYCMHGVAPQPREYCTGPHLSQYLTHRAASQYIEEQAELLVQSWRRAEGH